MFLQSRRYYSEANVVRAGDLALEHLDNHEPDIQYVPCVCDACCCVCVMHVAMSQPHHEGHTVFVSVHF